MALQRVYTYNTRTNWSSGGTINLNLAPVPLTITELWIIVHADITTTTMTSFNDPWDRIIASLSLTSGGKTLMQFSDMRPAYHLTRFGGFGTRRHSIVADSQTDALFEVAYNFHFGVCPTMIDKNGCLQRNPFDLTAGIPPVQNGDLSLTGVWGTTNAPGTNVTIATTGTPPTSMDIVFVGVQPNTGDPAELWMPRAFPNWQTLQPAITTVSTQFAAQENVPTGDFLHSIQISTYVGSNAPRSSLALSGLELFDQAHARSVWRIGGISDSNVSGRPAQEMSAPYLLGQPYSDNIQNLGGQTADELSIGPGIPSLNQSADAGLYYIPVQKLTSQTGPAAQYGKDLRAISTGDLQIRYGVPANSSNLARFVYKKYQLNPDHPLNAGL